MAGMGFRGREEKQMNYAELVARLRSVAAYKASLWANRYQKQAQGNETDAANAIEALLIECDRLKEVADEYDRCIRHMDAGGDFYEFQAQVVATNQRGGD
jgi:hypothetical protein